MSSDKKTSKRSCTEDIQSAIADIKKFRIHQPTLSNEKQTIEFDNILNKCRCCFKALNKQGKEITYDIRIKFFEIVQVELKFSKQCSSEICEICKKQLEEIWKIRQKFAEDQKRLYKFLDKDQEEKEIKGLENESLSYSNSDNDRSFQDPNIFNMSDMESRADCCKMNCERNISSLEIEKFQKNYSICNGSEAKMAFILPNVSEKPVLDGKTRKYSRSYQIGVFPVCFEFFCRVLGVSKGSVDNIMKKARSGSLKDRRTGNYKLSDEKINEMKNHINSFPRYMSHYKRETTSAQYLDPELTLSMMYKLFVEKWNEKYPQTKAPSESSYKKIFRKMGLKIKPLKTDTCKICDKFRHQIASASSSEKLQLEIEQQNHWKQATDLRKLMKQDFETGKNDSKVQGICYDLEKVFALPKASSNVFYYSRNLNVFNLGVHDGKTNKAHFHVWAENEGGRGAREIASCLIKYLESNLQEDAEILILWSDSCGGQNRNYIMCLMLHHFLSKQKNLKQIVLRFLQSGHSYNICDTDFSSVESAVRRKQSIFTPLEVIKIMENCRVNNPFSVTKMTVNDFLSCENLVKNITKRGIAEENGQKVSWIRTHEILLSKGHPFKMYMNYDVTKDDSLTLNYAKTSKGKVTSDPWDLIQCPLSNPQGRALSKEKLNDFRKNYALFPPDARDYFDKLLGGRSEDFDEDVDGFSSTDFTEHQLHD